MTWASELLTSWLGQHEDGCDPYIAAALHGYVDEPRKARLEALLFASARDRLRWASEPFTPSSVLAALACYDDARLNRRLARHAQTPAAALERIRKASVDVTVLASLAAHRNASTDLLRSLPWANVPEVRAGLADNPVSPSYLLASLLPLATAAERKLMAANPSADAPLLSALWETSAGDVYLLAEIAANSACPWGLHDVALRHSSSIVRRKLAGNPNIRTADLVVLLGDRAGEVRAEAARHAPLDDAAGGEDEPARAVRRIKARRHDLPAALIEKLAKDDDAWVRRWLARNPCVSADLLSDLAEDQDHEVRRGVARNPSCPKTLLLRAAVDSHPWVRAGVTFRPDIDGEIISLFANEDNIDVLSGLGRNGATPPAWLAKIAASENADLRRSVILNPRAPRDLLRRLAEDPYAFNRVSLLKNPALPAGTALELLSDPEPQVRFMAAMRLAREGESLQRASPMQPDEPNSILPQQRPLKSMGLAR